MKNLKEKKYSILKIIAKYSFVFILVFSFVLPFVFVNDVSALNSGIENPLGKTGPQDIPTFIQTILKVVLTVGVPVITLAIIYTGFLFVQAQGKSEELTKAKKTLLYTLIGAALLLGAFVIAQAIKGTVDEIIKNQ
jgi:hypothetical protein